MHSSAEGPPTGCQHRGTRLSPSGCMAPRGQWARLTRGPIREEGAGLSASSAGDTGVGGFAGNSLRTDPVWGAGCCRSPHTGSRSAPRPLPPRLRVAPRPFALGGPDGELPAQLHPLLSFIPCCGHRPGDLQTSGPGQALRRQPQLGVQPPSPPLGQSQADPHAAWQKEPCHADRATAERPAPGAPLDAVIHCLELPVFPLSRELPEGLCQMLRLCPGVTPQMSKAVRGGGRGQGLCPRHAPSVCPDFRSCLCCPTPPWPGPRLATASTKPR